jgi:hypothetical protein
MQALLPGGGLDVTPPGERRSVRGDTETSALGCHAGHYWIVEPIWDDRAADDRCIAWGRKAAARLAAVSLRENYVNEQSDVVASSAYGDEKYQRLARLKFRYDPMA